MKIYVGKAELEVNESGVKNNVTWECVVFAYDEKTAKNKVINEIRTSPHMQYVTNIINVNIETTAVIA